MKKEQKTRSILTILAAISGRGATGTLRFEVEPDSESWIEFLFRQGQLLFATSNRKGERLGEFLVRRGALNKEQALEALQEARRRKQLFHAQLVESGLIDLEQLKDLLFQRTEDLLGAILKSEDGQFTFLPNQPPELERTLGLWVDEELFGRLLKRRKAWPRVYERFRDRKLVLQHSGALKDTNALKTLGAGEKKLLELIDGSVPVAKILRGRKNRLDLMIALDRFWERGWLEQVGGKGLSARPAAKPIHPPGGHKKEPVEYGAFDPEAVPSFTQGTSLDRISVSGLMMDDLFLVSQIDGRLSIRELLWITGLSIEKVRRIFDRLLTKGYLNIKDPDSKGLANVPRDADLPPRSAPVVARATPKAPAATKSKSSAATRPKSPAPATKKSSEEEAGQDASDLYTLQDKARAAYNAKHPRDAVRCFHLALKQVPDDVLLRAQLAISLLDQQERREQGMREARRAYKGDPTHPAALEAMGLSHLRLGMIEKARHYLQQAMLRDKNQRISSAARVLSKIKRSGHLAELADDSLWETVRPLVRFSS